MPRNDAPQHADVSTAPAAMRPVSLRFESSLLEQAYHHFYTQWLRGQARIAIGIGIFLFILDGLIDLTLSQADLSRVWTLRLILVLIGLVGLGYTYTHRFERHNQVPMALLSLIGAGGLIAIQLSLGSGEAIRYFPSLMLTTFWAYLFLGLRFTSALATGVAIFIIYNLSQRFQHLPDILLLDQNYDLLAANVIAAFAAYFSERQRRTLFHQRCLIDQERQVHLQHAMEDELTRLPNRRHLEQSLERLLGEEGMQAHAGLFVDIDHFKPVNDRYGHEVGDAALRIIAQRIRQATRDSDIVCRLGGDEFFVILMDVEGTDAAQRVADKLLSSLQQPLTIDAPDGERVRCTISASLGIITFPFEDATPSTILSRADRAMYRAKAAGRNGYALFDPQLDLQGRSSNA
ncbi:GGDEF domain-containing protein [Acidihalobacter prosperus]|nr:GGDEF domain-containing protein [Acidihalobacter prosperus]